MTETAANTKPGQENAPKVQPFQIRGSMQTLLSIRLITPNDPAFFTQLQAKVAHAPEFYRDAPLVIDVAPIASLPPIDIDAFCEKLRALRIKPIGLQNGTETWNEAARASGLAIFAPGKAGALPETSSSPGQSKTKAAPLNAAPLKGAGLIITEPVRGGQQIHNDDGDVTVLASVSDGAEVASVGNIHVYGTLRGRVFAGTGGDEGAMIFCECMDAQLISIAGVHMVNEDIDPALLKRRVRVHCDGERLVMAPLP